MAIPILEKMSPEQVNKARMGSGHGPGCEECRTLISGARSQWQWAPCSKCQEGESATGRYTPAM
eukprot:4533422-Prorocentrum_lima.AAC.1